MVKCIFVVSCEEAKKKIMQLVSESSSAEGIEVLLTADIPSDFEGILCCINVTLEDCENEFKLKNSLYQEHGSFSDICSMSGSQPIFCLSRHDPQEYIGSLAKFQPNIFEATSVSMMVKPNCQTIHLSTAFATRAGR